MRVKQHKTKTGVSIINLDLGMSVKGRKEGR